MTSKQAWPGRRLSRRGFLQVAGGAAAGGLVLGACGSDDNGSAAATATGEPATAQPQGAIGPVDQVKERRRGAGLTGWDPEKAFEGYTLYSPNDGREAQLVDMDGTVVHTWQLLEPEDPKTIRYVDLLENGNIMAVTILATGDAPPYVFKGGGIKEVDWDGNTVWELDHPDQHHDARVLPNGNVLLLNAEEVPADVASRLQGGRVEGGDGFWADYVVESTLDGEVVWEWHAWEHLDPDAYVVNPEDRRNDWTHGNSARRLPNGDLLISMRNVNTVAIVNRDSGEVTWRLTTPAIAQQHDAMMLDNGNVLVFDNGPARLDTLPHSRVIEVDPATDEVIWEYRDQAFLDFFSSLISSAQRLPNGNTLVNEGLTGRIFEVTSEGEIVWEYISPLFVDGAILGITNSVFRAYRYPRDAFAMP